MEAGARWGASRWDSPSPELTGPLEVRRQEVSRHSEPGRLDGSDDAVGAPKSSKTVTVNSVCRRACEPPQRVPPDGAARSTESAQWRLARSLARSRCALKSGARSRGAPIVRPPSVTQNVLKKRTNQS